MVSMYSDTFQLLKALLQYYNIVDVGRELFRASNPTPCSSRAA